MKHFYKQKRIIRILSNVLLFRRSRPPDLSSIVIFDFHMIGDMVLLIPLIRSLRRAHPSSRIVLVAPSWARPIHEGLSCYDEHIVYHAPWVQKQSWITAVRELVRLVFRLRKERFCTGIEVRGDLRQIALMSVCKVRSIVGYSFTGGRKLLALDVFDDGQIKSILDHHQQIARALGGSEDDFLPEILLSSSEREQAHKFRNSFKKKVVAIHPFASRPLREWPARNLQELLERLSDRFDCVVFCSNAERDRALEIVVPRVQVISSSLRDFIVRLSTCDFFVGMDSGPAHIAAALGVPSLVLFGPQDSEFSKPRGRASISIREVPGLKCRPCDQFVCVNENHQACMDYSVESVLNGIKP